LLLSIATIYLFSDSCGVEFNKQGSHHAVSEFTRLLKMLAIAIVNDRLNQLFIATNVWISKYVHSHA